MGICRGSSWDKEEEFARERNDEDHQIVRMDPFLILFWAVRDDHFLLLFTIAVTDRMNMCLAIRFKAKILKKDGCNISNLSIISIN